MVLSCKPLRIPGHLRDASEKMLATTKWGAQPNSLQNDGAQGILACFQYKIVVTNPRHRKSSHEQLFGWFLYIMTWHQYNFNSNKWPDSVHPRVPGTVWRNQGHHVNHLKYDFVRSISLQKNWRLSILYWCYLRATKNDVKPQVAVENCALFCCHVRSGIEIYVVVVDPCWKVAVPSSESTK